MTTRLLIVDDDANLCKTLHRVVEEFSVAHVDGSVHVATATTAEAAIRHLHAFPEDAAPVVLSDYDLRDPSWTGVHLLAEAKRRFPRAGLLLMSGRERDLLLAEAARAGAHGVLQKPFGPIEMMGAIRSARLANDQLRTESRMPEYPNAPTSD